MTARWAVFSCTPWSATLFAILETLLMVNLRDELVAENGDAQADGAYHYGL